MHQSILVVRLEGTCVTSGAAPLNSYFACMPLLRRPFPQAASASMRYSVKPYPHRNKTPDYQAVSKHSQKDMAIVRSFH